MSQPLRAKLVFSLLIGCGILPANLDAQTPPPDDAVLNRAQPDFTVVNLPTSLRLPKWKSAFRLTHRFTRPINCATNSDVRTTWLEDLFGLDEGALIGLEFRMGVAPNTQVGIQRARIDKTIDIFGQYALDAPDGAHAVRNRRARRHRRNGQLPGRLFANDRRGRLTLHRGPCGHPHRAVLGRQYQPAVG